MLDKKRVTLYLAKDSYFQLKVYAISQEKSVSKIVDDWVQDFLAKNVYGTPPRPKVVKPASPSKKLDKNGKCPHGILGVGYCRVCDG